MCCHPFFHEDFFLFFLSFFVLSSHSVSWYASVSVSASCPGVFFVRHPLCILAMLYFWCVVPSCLPFLWHPLYSNILTVCMCWWLCFTTECNIIIALILKIIVGLMIRIAIIIINVIINVILIIPITTTTTIITLLVIVSSTIFVKGNLPLTIGCEGLRRWLRQDSISPLLKFISRRHSSLYVCV